MDVSEWMSVDGCWWMEGARRMSMDERGRTDETERTKLDETGPMEPDGTKIG
jgi:hypothetical protein